MVSRTSRKWTQHEVGNSEENAPENPKDTSEETIWERPTSVSILTHKCTLLRKLG